MIFKQLSDGSMVDQSTGEVLGSEDGTFIYVPSRIKFNEDWFMAFQDAREMLALDKELWGQPRAVLDYLESKLSFENYIAVEQISIAKKLDIDKSRVSDSIKKLVDKGIIEKGPRIGRACSYKLNPVYGWKGKVKNLKHERKRRLKILDGGIK